jgi:hypothetical protein
VLRAPLLDVAATPDPAAGELANGGREVVALAVAGGRPAGHVKDLRDLGDAGEVLRRHVERGYAVGRIAEVCHPEC